ncbi:PadR family transcriptional regulator [Nocardia donostiensis]|uniref:Transcriptional regulator n=1 Tax=Nocardia donostiensis TaxID=1538463 RepID=A0A1W0AZY1_9NOCA|nr:helix-turn-helix transcriptional regulator [Nocardia donostiensis]ONM50133.1 transcriptional regulator [Nocardia donostiensis]OQS15795.1 transcriptional regulator [Nocardia donostiensis]OQS23600.1 transcriptional regulator [Nocardia donostiensis]
MSSVRLLVLGVMRTRQPIHGYAVRQELLSWRADTWTNVKPGSIYHALKQLTQEGKLRALGTEGSTQGPGRTLFELTETGEAEFRTLMDEALVSIDMEEFGAALAFMDALPREHVIEKLREQQTRTRAVHDELLAMIGDFPGRYDPPHATDLLELWSSVFANFADWTSGVLGRLEAGEYRMADDDR